MACFSPFDTVTVKLVLVLLYPVWCKRDRIPDHRDPLQSPIGSPIPGLLSTEAGSRAGPACPVKFIVHSIKGSNGQQRGLNVSPVT